MPAEFLCRPQILFRQSERQGRVGLSRCQILLVPLPPLGQLVIQVRLQGPGQHDHPVLAAFAVAHGELVPHQVEVLDADLTALLPPQSCPVEQADLEPKQPIASLDSVQEAAHFFGRQHRRHPAVVYGRRFQAASGTLREVAADPKYLGAQLGVVAVRHTWGQNLHHHPHLHCLVTGGGLSCDRSGRIDESPCWRSCRPGFFLPVRVLGQLFRGKFLALLRQAQEQGRLSLAGRLSPLAEAAGFAAWLRPLYRQDWVVYSQPPTARTEVVLKYLSRYVHRSAISNSRLVSLNEEEVSFSWKDYGRGEKSGS